MALPETNLTLIARMKDPVDQRAWQEFVGAYEPFLLRMLIRRGFMDADARDLVQQVFLGVCRSLDQWNSDGIEGSFRRWLSGVTRNKGRQPLNIGGSDFLNQQLELPDSDVDVAKLQQEYDREIFLFVAEQVRREFREQSWQAFWKTAVEGQDVARVAIEQGVERGAIYMSRSRIMARIRSRIAELGEQEAL